MKASNKSNWYDIAGEQRRCKQIEQFITYRMEGLSQKEAAKLVGVSQKTICCWKKKYPERFEQLDAYMKGKINNPFKMHGQLYAFLPLLRIHEPELYPQVMKFVNVFEARIKQY